MTKKEDLTVSFSGGESSAYMTFRILDEYRGKFERIGIVFANTGLEREETLEFVYECEKRIRESHCDVTFDWVEAVIPANREEGLGYRIVTFNTASRKGEPFEQMISRYGIPNQNNPFCSERTKHVPMQKYRKDYGFDKSVKAIGIRYDEWDRASSNAHQHNFWYPMIEWKVQKADVSRFWSKQDFRLNLRSYETNCSACWKKSDKVLAKIMRERPQDFEFFERMEREYGTFVPPTQASRPSVNTFYRGARTVQDIRDISKSLEADPTDLHSITKSVLQLDLLDLESGHCAGECVF